MEERYQKTRLIGKGRAGEVHEGLDSLMSRKVVIRRFPDHKLELDGLSEEWKSNFESLICGLSRMNHPSLLGLIDGGLDADGPYLISSYIEGKSLSDLAHADDDDFSIVDVYEMAEQMLDALIMAEQEGFYHLAFSPSSIIAQPKFPRGYTYVLADLGHSKLIPMIHGQEKIVAMTQHPVLLAPELYEGRPQGGKTTQYILGNLLYWLLAHGHPFADLSLEEAYQHHKIGALESLLNFRLEVPKDFVRWLNVLMQPDPAKRYETLYEALQAMPEAPKRIYAKKVVMPPKPISEADLSATA